MTTTQHLHPLPPPTLRKGAVQLAMAGVWEAAVNVDSLSPGELIHWLRTAELDVALEVLFETDSGALEGFVGLRVEDADPDARVRFWTPIIAQAQKARSVRSKDYASFWSSRLGLADPTGDRPPDGWEIGVFNQWRSATPVILSDQAAPRRSDAPPSWILEGATAPICLEAVWTQPRLWEARVVSRAVKGRHVLDRETIAAAFPQMPETVRQSLGGLLG